MRIIAYYLPQFHTIPENDRWWGKGFTEWTSVRRARPLFPGHRQPVEPGELGYYNLLDADTRRRQADLAREAGVEGFCYWHYWFGDGRQLLEKPLQQVLQSGQPDYPFCIGWANEDWRAKVWSDTTGKSDRVLIRQTYPEGDTEQHFRSVLPLFLDRRYIRVNGKPLVVIYRPFDLPDARGFIARWNEMAREAGLEGIFFVGHTLYSAEADKIRNLGFDAVNVVRLGDCRRSRRMIVRHCVNLMLYALHLIPFVYSYRAANRVLTGPEGRRADVFPSLIPRWDHTPRSGRRGFVLNSSTPDLFREQIRTVRKQTEQKEEELRIVFLKSWNEWGEGNYIEPDSLWGKQYLQVLKEENL
jgi:hypothetical protein